MKSHGFIVIAFLASLLTGCYTQKEIEAAKDAADKDKVKLVAAPGPDSANTVAPVKMKGGFVPYEGPTKDYVVNSGDSIGRIAVSYGISIRALKALNGLKGDALRAGQKLKVPTEKQTPAATQRAREEAAEARRRAQAEAEARSRRAQEEAQKIRGELVNKPPYRIIDLVREKGSDFAYAFSLEMVGDTSIQTFFGVQNIFASEVRTAYLMEYPNVDPSALRVVVQPRLSNGRIVGRAEVLTITPVSLTYDPNTRKGKLAVKVNANQYEEARKWIRKNIETLARDKNIALTTGESPPAAKFYLGREELKDGNILEIEFTTE